MGLVCQRCRTNVGLYKEILDDGKVMITCTLCGWKTGKLNRHDYDQYIELIPTSDEMHRKAEDWK